MAVVSLLTAVAAVAVVPAAPATADHRWSGYSIKNDGTAAGGWIGGRKANSRVVYRVDARKRDQVTRYRSAKWAGAFRAAGKRHGSRRATARAAYILGKYGSYRYRVQNAAVDAAVHHLLTGGRWRIDRSKGRARIRRAGDSSAVRSFARIMLKESKRKAGPYRLRVSAKPVRVGSKQKVHLRVVSARGVGIANLPLRIRYEGRSTVKKRTTGDKGRATVAFTATRGGPRKVRVRIGKLLPTKLRILPARKRRASRAAVADVKVARTRAGTVPVRVEPTVNVATVKTVEVQRTRAAAQLSIVGGYTSRRKATTRLYGPFGSQAAASCAGSPVAVNARTVSSNGTYKVAGLVPPRAGWYVWGVAVAKNRYNTSARSCGGHMRVKWNPTVSFPSPVKTRRTRPFRVRVKLGSVPSNYAEALRVRISGPYKSGTAARCDRVTETVKVKASGPGRYRTSRVALSRPGFYRVQVVAPSTTWVDGKKSRCRTKGARVRITR